jgi:hypothetical protein
MIKQFAFILIIALRLAYNPAKETITLSAFALPSASHTTQVTLVPGNETEIHTGSSERLILKWIIGDNRPADCLRTVKEIYEFNSNESMIPYVKPVLTLVSNS